MNAELVTRLMLAPEVVQLAGERVAWFALPRGMNVGGRVLLFKLSPGREYDHDGADGLDGPTVQFDCLAEDPDVAAALALAVRDEMEREAEIEGTRFHPAQQLGETFSDGSEADGGNRVFRVSMDFQFYFEEI